MKVYGAIGFIATCVLGPTVVVSETTILTDFEKPEDLRDLPGTSYILVSESSLSRKDPGTLSLLDTNNNSQRVPLWPPAGAANAPSLFADPACTSATTISPHGIDVLVDENDSTMFHVAVVNHFDYESIEFYVIMGTSLYTAGCTRELGRGDMHNAVSYLPTTPPRLVVSLWYTEYYGVIGRLAFLLSYFNPLPWGSGALKEVAEGGEATIVEDLLSGANGVLFVDPNRVVVAETANFRVVEVDPDGEKKEAIQFAIAGQLCSGF